MSKQPFDVTAFLRDLEGLVNIDSGSSHPAGVAKIAAFFAQRFGTRGWTVTTHNFDNAVGPCLEIVYGGDKEKFDLLLVGHMDTVFPVGTAAERPFRIQDNRAYGPGVVDMKAGLLLMDYALEGLQEDGALTGASICVAMNSDEEIGSVYSRPWIERLAAKSRYVFILEPARANGALVNKRKGVGRYTVEFTGVAAHSGVEPEKGRSAINELAHWILALHGLNNPATGMTVNVGVVAGGTVANVVAAHAKAEIDVRITDEADVVKLEQTMADLIANPKTPGVSAKVSGGINRPPMNPTAETLRLCQATDAIAARLGVPISWAATGGGSDGNFSAALGIPTLDGLGPVGGGAHGVAEYLEISSVAPRLELLRELIAYVIKN